MNVETHLYQQTGKDAQKIKFVKITIRNYRVNYGESIIVKKIALKIGFPLKN